MSDYNYYNQLFDEYTDQFLKDTKENTWQNIRLKIVHSKNVEKNCNDIAKSEKLDNESTFTAKLCGLFHDIGRFEQYTKYHTFRDDNSVYHGQLGVEVLNETGFLKDLPEKTTQIILKSTYNHGLIQIPEETKGETLYFSKLTRDADKTDIYRIVSEYYHQSGPRNIALEYGLEDTPVISENIMEDFMNGKLISKSSLKTLNDFKTMQLSWIFDINFNYTKEMILKNRYLDSIL